MNKECNKAYTTWIKKIINDFVSSNKNEFETDNFYLSNHLLFLTFNFNEKSLINRMKKKESSITIGEIHLNQFNHFYNLVCKTILGSSFHRRPSEEKPFSLVCLDANGSRYWKEMGDIKNIHLHSLWVMRPGTKEALLSVKDRALSMNMFDFESIHAEPFKTNLTDKKSLETLISYTVKFEKFNQHDAKIAEVFRIYPLRQDGGQSGFVPW